MSRGRWGVLAAIVGCLIGSGYLWYELAPRNPDLPRYETSEAGGARYQPGGGGCEPRALSRLPIGKAANERQRCAETAEEHRLKSDDLVQQTRSADAAKAVAELAYDQSRMILATAIIGFLTLIAALFAAGFAWRASEHGRISNLISERESRPILVPGNWEAQRMGVGARVIFRFKWMNSGTLPAVVVSGKFYRADAADPGNQIQVGEWIDDAPNRKPHQIDKPGIITPPNRDHESAWVMMGERQHGTIAEYVYGKIAYKNAIDPAEEPWISEICGTLVWVPGAETDSGADQFFFEPIAGTVKVT